MDRRRSCWVADAWAIQEIIDDPDHWVDDSDQDQSRFSLGGNQGKFALAKIDSQWFEPNGRTASTHIIKPGMATRGHAPAPERLLPSPDLPPVPKI